MFCAIILKGGRGAERREEVKQCKATGSRADYCSTRPPVDTATWAGPSTWRPELFWACRKKEPDLRAGHRGERRAVSHQLPPSSHRSGKLSSPLFYVALSLSGCCSRRSQKLQVGDWWVQLPSGTLNTLRARGCWWWKVSYLVRGTAAKGLWQWAVYPFLWWGNNRYCTLPFFFFFCKKNNIKALLLVFVSYVRSQCNFITWLGAERGFSDCSPHPLCFGKWSES